MPPSPPFCVRPCTFGGDFELSAYANSHCMHQPGNSCARSSTFLSRFMLEFFRSAGLHRGTCATLIDQLSKVISFLTSDSHSAHRNGNSIQKFVDAVKVCVHIMGNGII